MTPTISGNLIAHLEYSEPQRGCWVAYCRFIDEAANVTGRVTLELGDRHLSGTVIRTGTHGARKTVVVVGGAGKWGTTLTAKPYHLDSGVPAKRCMEDMCRELGETMGTFVPASALLGKDFVRNATKASTILEAIIGSANWWVDDAGNTNVGTRPTAPTITSYTVQGYDGEHQTVDLALQDYQIGVGSLISKQIESPKTIQSLQLTVDENGIRAKCWVQPNVDLQSLVRNVIQSMIDASAPQLRRYRVLSMLADGRVELQAVNKRLGYPDLVSVSQYWGVPGVHATLKQGAEVVVGFLDGSREEPFIFNGADKLTASWIPDEVNLSAGTKGAARLDDDVTVELPHGEAPSGGGPIIWTPHTVSDPVITAKISSASSKVVIG